MLVSKLITAVTLLVSTAVQASPTPQPGAGDSGLEKTIFARNLSEKFLHLFALHVRTAFKEFGPPPTKTEFHSNIGWKKAKEIARTRGRRTAEDSLYLAVKADTKSPKPRYKDTIAKYCGVDRDTYCEKIGPRKDWETIWGIVSKEWADYAEDETILDTSKEGPKKDSFWKKYEEPILEEKEVKIRVDDGHPSASEGSSSKGSSSKGSSSKGSSSKGSSSKGSSSRG